MLIRYDVGAGAGSLGISSEPDELDSVAAHFDIARARSRGIT
jgi:hypothetical protein